MKGVDWTRFRGTIRIASMNNETVDEDTGTSRCWLGDKFAHVFGVRIGVFDLETPIGTVVTNPTASQWVAPM